MGRLSVAILLSVAAILLLLTGSGLAQYWQPGVGPVNLQWQWGSGRSEQHLAFDMYNGTSVWVFNDPGDATSYASKLIVGRTGTHPRNWFIVPDSHAAGVQEVVVATAPGTSPIRPSIAHNRNGVWVIAFSAKLNGDTDLDIWFVRSMDDGITWSTPARLDIRGSSESYIDDFPIVIYEPTAGQFWCAWLSNQKFNGPNGQPQTKGDINIVAANSSDSVASGWSIGQYVNDNWGSTWDDEKSVTMFLGSPPGTIHIAFSTGAYHHLNLSSSNYDYVVITKNASSSVWNNARRLNSDQGAVYSVDNYSDEQFHSSVASDGVNVVHAYYRVLTGPWINQLLVSVSRDGGWTFSDPYILDTNTWNDKYVSVTTDMKGTFNVMYVSKKGTYTFDNGVVLTVGQGNDGDVYYSVVTMSEDSSDNASFTRPRPVDLINLPYPTQSSDSGDNKGQVGAVDPVTGTWAAIFLSSKRTFKLNETTYYGPNAEYNVMGTWWSRKNEELCAVNAKTLPVYCFQNLKTILSSAPDSSVEYKNIHIAYLPSITETIRIDNGTWLSFSPAFKGSQWEIGSSFPNFEILDSSSKLRYTGGVAMAHSGGSFFVKNTGGSKDVLIHPSDYNGFACPLGFSDQHEEFCTMCPEGGVCTDRTSATHSMTCSVGRFCPPATFNDELFKCNVYRHYNETGYSSKSNCSEGGEDCIPGYFCPPGALTSQHTLLVNLSKTQFDETVVFPGNTEVSFQAEVFGHPAMTASDILVLTDEQTINPSAFPPWLQVSGLTSVTLNGLTGGTADLVGLLRSKVAGVSIADTLIYDYQLHVRNSATGEDLIKPVSAKFSRTVTTVVFNPEEGILDHVSIYSPPFEREMLIFNIGCESSLNWTASVVACTDPDHVLDWVSTSTSQGIIPVGSIDPAVINVEVNFTTSIQPEGQLYNQIALALAAQDETPTAESLLGTRGVFTASACLSVQFRLLGQNVSADAPVSQLRKVAPIELRLFETCPPGRFSATGSSEDGSCDLCPVGTYATDRGATACRSCPEELPRTVPGASSHAACLAAPGTFLDSTGQVLRCDQLGDGVECLSDGTTLTTLTVKAGYWRSRKDSKSIFKCINPGFCRGNVVASVAASRRLQEDEDNNSSLLVTNEYCIEHHLGPMCEGCEEHYVRRGLSQCSICDEDAIAGDRMRLGWTICAAVLIVVIAFLVVQWNGIVKFVRKRRDTIMATKIPTALVAFSSSSSSSNNNNDLDEKGTPLPPARSSASSSGAPSDRPRSRRNPAEFVRGVSVRVRQSTKIDKRMTLLWKVVVSIEANVSVRILLSLFQVINGVSKTFFDLLPAGFHSIAAAFNVVSAEIFYRIDFGCILKSNHNLSLILSMAAPIIFTMLILIIHLIMERRLKSQKRLSDVSKLRNGTFSIFLLLLFLIYPGVSNTVLSTFACREFDGGLRYLRKDLTVSCNAPDRHIWVTIAAFGVILYTIGIPMFYMLSLWKVRKYLNPASGEKPNPENYPHVTFLTSIYKPKFYWWEVFELIRKLVQTSVIVFIVDGSLMQTVFMVSFTMVVVILLNELKPYVNSDANRLAYVAQWQILIISFLTLLYRVDLSEIDRNVSYDKKTMLDVCVMSACFLAPGLALFQSRRALLRFAKFIIHKTSNSCCCRPCCGRSSRPTATTMTGSKIADDDKDVEVEELGDHVNKDRRSFGHNQARASESDKRSDV